MSTDPGIRETRIQWDEEEPLPEGWRRCAHWLRDDGDMDQLYTAAPKDRSPFDFEHRFVRLRRRVQERFVTEWADCREAP